MLNAGALSGLLLAAFIVKFLDPITWAVLACAIVAASLRYGWLWALIAAAIGAAFAAWRFSGHPNRIGVPFDPVNEWFSQFVLISIWSMLVFAVARCAGGKSG